MIRQWLREMSRILSVTPTPKLVTIIVCIGVVPVVLILFAIKILQIYIDPNSIEVNIVMFFFLFCIGFSGIPMILRQEDPKVYPIKKVLMQF
jgi:hypothetical protein